tara:strand:- start:47 stop:778 length:732 start_codon:yes stop_codon:yes gene_type:complete
MNKNKLKVICIIPARGGSKGIKLKNIQQVNKKPLIYYPISAAIKSQVCDKIFVSTDSPVIARYGKKYGAEVPFLRKKKYSGDYITTETTLKNALKSYEIYYKTKFDICVFLTCTNIFRNYKNIKIAVERLKKNKNIDTVLTATQLYRHFWHYKNGKLTKVLPWMKRYHSRQKAPILLREEAGITCVTRAKFWRKGFRIGNKVSIIKNNFPFSDIDIHTKDDIKIANSAIKIILKNKKFKNYLK